MQIGRIGKSYIIFSSYLDLQILDFFSPPEGFEVCQVELLVYESWKFIENSATFSIAGILWLFTKWLTFH